MKITVSRTESVYNRATREYELREYPLGSSFTTEKEDMALRRFSKEYGMSVAGFVALVVSYYFGDGKNHFGCEFCDFWENGCNGPEPGTQTTLPLLDQGSVVVGLSSADQGF